MTTIQVTGVDTQFKERIGIVIGVGPSQVKVQLLSHAKPTYGGSSRSVDVRSYLTIGCGSQIVFGQICRIDRDGQGEALADMEEVQGFVAADVQLLASIETKTGAILRGVIASPQLGDEVYRAPSYLVKVVVEGKSTIAQAADHVCIDFAQLADGTPLDFTPEKIFGRHCALLGASGGGKSWSIARLLEEAAHLPRAKVILFDATGEYYRLTGPLKGNGGEKLSGVRHAYMGEDADLAEGAVQVSLPFHQLLEKDLFAIFKPSIEHQAPRLRAAVRSLKLAWLEPALAPDGTIVKAHKSKKQYEEALIHHAAHLESPFAEYDISRLPRQIELECVNPQRSSQEPHVWGDVNGSDRAACTPLVNRIQEIMRSTSLAPIFRPDRRRSLFQEISAFLSDNTMRVLRISLRDLSFAHHAREIVANAAGRLLLEIARNGYFKEQPLLVVVDEAHQFLNKALQSEDEIYPLDSFALIAKEGRKYSLSILIATQRARDIPEGVLSQIGTLVVHRLINDQDRLVVERAAGSLDRTSLDSLPILVPGEAIVVGADFPVPLSVRVNTPRCEPDSRGPNYQNYWG